MGESHEQLIKAVRHCQEGLDKYTENRKDAKLLHYLERLYKLPIKVIHLEQTGVGRTVNGLRKLGGEVGHSAKSLVAKWKAMVVGEQEEEDANEEEEEEEDDDEEEDGYQSGEDLEPSNDSEKEECKEKIKHSTSSSHRKSDSNRTDEKTSKQSTAKYGDSSKNSKKNRHHNGHSSTSSRHKSHHQKRKEETSSEDEIVNRNKKHKEESSEVDEEEVGVCESKRKKRKIETESEDEEPPAKMEKKQKLNDQKKKHKVKKLPGSSPECEVRKHSTGERKDKEKNKSLKKHEHSNKEKEKKSSLKPKEKSKYDKKDKSSKGKGLNGNTGGIDSGSGASFAEALGMCEPSSSKNSTTVKKKSGLSEKKPDISSSKNEDTVPKLLKEPTLEPIDLNISSLLPTITPNYRPIGNYIHSDAQPKKAMSDYEALSNIITSKNQRTKVYSGNKMGYGKVPSLFELCIRILQDNIDALEYTGGVPYVVLKPILEKANPNQLYLMEHHNPYLIEDTDELWQLHCQKEFRNKKREELESWREMYMRCLDEREAKLKALTANIKQAQDKSLPVRTTKLAYVDAVAKPPRNIARKQAKNGTAFVGKPSMTPSARLSSLATSGEAGKVAVPNPGARAMERSSNQVIKPKKAPLMAKSLSLLKNRFRR